MRTPSNRSDGFTILELIIAMVIMVIMAAYGGSALLRAQLQQKRADTAANEIFSLIDSVANYVNANGSWPDEGNACANVITSLAQDNYILTSDLESPWHTPYQFNCASGDNMLSIAVNTRDNKWARYLAGVLPLSVVMPDSTTGTTVALSLPKDLFIATDLADKAYLRFQYVTNSDPDVYKPNDCPDHTKPAIYSAIAGMADGKAAHTIGAAYLSVDDLGDHWTVNGTLTTVDGTKKPGGNYMQMLVVTQCEPE